MSLSFPSSKSVLLSVTALVVASQVAVGTSPAAAASFAADYSCTTPIGPQTFTADVTFEPPAAAVTGTEVPSRPINVKVTIPAGLVGLIKLSGVTAVSGSVADADYRVGSLDIPVTGLAIPLTPLPDGALELSADGTAQAFTAPAPGTHAVKLPASFKVHVQDQNGATLTGSPFTCTLAPEDDVAIAQLTVTSDTPPIVKVASTTSVTLKNAPITTKKAAKLGVVVKATGKVPTGKVTAKLGTRVLRTGTLVAGKVTLKLPKLTKGRKRIVVRYSGSAFVNPSRKSITIRVKQP